MKLKPLRILSLLILLFVLISVAGGSAIWSLLGLSDELAIDGNAKIVREAHADIGTGWPSYGGDPGGSRYSGADDIRPANVGKLQEAWTFRSGALAGKGEASRRSAFEATPILVDDHLIFCTQFNEVIALDPGNGKSVWRYDPKVPTDGRPANQFTCRGVSHWVDMAAPADAPCRSRIFAGTVDARLIALDSRTGRLCPGFGKGGMVRVEPDIALRWPGEFQITSAPAILGDLVITGVAIGDNLRTNAPLGTVHAFDARSGEMKWRFNPVPRNAADPARASWAGNSADITGHANVWSTISVDAARNLVIIPTSSPSPDYFGGNRRGDNLYANSVVALDGRTGKPAWHFQTVHHDLWDYDVPAQPGLYQVWRNGRAHDVVAQVTKTGLVFVLDRDTGKPFLPVEERPVPQGGAAGEFLSPTQPFPVNTPPLVSSRLDPQDAFGITLWDKQACAAQIRKLRREGLFTPPSAGGTLAYPFTGGGGNWGSAAYDPARNLMIVNMNNIAAFVRLHPRKEKGKAATEIADDAEFAPMEGAPYAMSRAPLLSPLGLPCSPPPWGVLAAVDLSSGKIVWRRKIGTTEDLAPGGLALNIGVPAMGGPVVTAGGVVFLAATLDDYLRAFDVETGRELWKGRLPAGGQATPMTYKWKGRQYVVIAAGGHGTAGTRMGDHIIAYALPR